MIEDRIQILRRAAQISSKEKNEKVWGVIAGNDRLLDDIAFNAITAKDRVTIIFRETISIEERYTAKKFDCILLHGEDLKISELSNYSRENGGASLQITKTYLKDEPNLLVVLGPEDNMKRFVGETNRQNVKIDILIDDYTTGFIKSEIKSNIKIPSFLKSTITPILDTSEVILSALLISVSKEEDIDKIKSISQDNNLFGIDLKSTIQDKENQIEESDKDENDNDKKDKIDKKDKKDDDKTDKKETED